MAFTREWSDECSEDAEAKSFWDAFFHVFGINRRRVASFEVPLNKADGRGGFIDLLWKGMLLVEHKSRGRNLDRAFRQAFDYFPGIKDRNGQTRENRTQEKSWVLLTPAVVEDGSI